MIEIIVNTNNKTSLKYLSLLEQKLAEKEIIYTVFRTTSTITAENLIHLIRGENVIVIGGDGTFNEIINNHINKNIIYLPGGSGNDLARALSINNNVDNILEKILSNKIEKFDVGLVNDKKFCTSFDLGFNADVIKRVTNSKLKNILKKYIYFFYGLITLFTIKKYKAEITINNKIIKTNNLLLFNAMILPYSGGGIKFSEHATGKDGKLHVMIIKDMSIFKFIYNFLCLFLKKYSSLKNVELYETDTVEIISDQNYYQIDGEYIKNNKPLTIKCLKSFYKIKR